MLIICAHLARKAGTGAHRLANAPDRETSPLPSAALSDARRPTPAQALPARERLLTMIPALDYGVVLD